MKYKLVSGYRDDDTLRKAYNALVGGRFAIDFEPWYQAGFWGENFNPYSLWDGEKLVSSISVNHMHMLLDGEKRHYIQLGGVTTADGCWGQGLSRYLMECIFADYEDKVDGIYLFGNDTVKQFYPKFGFRVSQMYRYSKSISVEAAVDGSSVTKVDMDDIENQKRFLAAYENSVPQERLHMDNKGLLMFYAAGFLKDCVYYLKDLDAYIIAEKEEETLHLHMIIAPRLLDPEAAAKQMATGCTRLLLGFIPLSDEGYERELYVEEDCTYFIKGKDLDRIEQEHLMFPTLSHA